MFSTARSNQQAPSLSSPSQPSVSASASSHSSPLSSLILQAQQFKSQSQPDLQASSDGKPPQFHVKVTKKSETSSSSSSQKPISDVNLVRSIRVILNSPTSKSPSQLTVSLQSLINDTQRLTQAEDSSTLCSVLYDKVQMEMERAIGQLSKSLESDSSASSSSSNSQSQTDTVEGRKWLDQLNTGWLEWCDRCSLACSVLLPLDRKYILPRTPSILSLWDLSLDLFKHKILLSETLQDKLFSSVLSSINAERGSNSGDSSHYKSLHLSLLSMIETLQFYQPLKAKILESTKDFYQKEARESITTLKVDAYSTKVWERIQQERSMSQWIFLKEDNSKDDANKTGQVENDEIVHRELVGNHIEELAKGLPMLLSSSLRESLSLLYNLFSKVEALPALRASFSTYIRSTGELIVKDKDRDEEMIQRLLDYKSSIDGIVSECFADHPDFQYTVKESFEKIINIRDAKVSELIAKYLDVKLKSGNKTMTDQELEKVLDDALILFRYTKSKDMFEEFYKRHFAKRLLLNKSASSDAEQSMLLKLREECGYAFTQKLETMLKDISLSEDIMKSFELSSEAKNSRIDFDLSVNVLTLAHWPTTTSTSKASLNSKSATATEGQIIIPSNLAQAADVFESFYKTRNSGRRLQWQHSLGHLTLKAHFPKVGEKELFVSTYQAIILMLFNEDLDDAQSKGSGRRLSYKDILSQTGLDPVDLKRTLQSLACGQIPTRVLRKYPQGKEVDETDEFAFNDGFKNDRHRIRINQIQMKETAEEQKATEERVLIDRELVLQAAAVRILKAKKTIKHNDLINEVVDAIKSRFQLEVSEIKKTFEILIDKEYMERVEGERGLYRYLA